MAAPTNYSTTTIVDVNGNAIEIPATYAGMIQAEYQNSPFYQLIQSSAGTISQNGINSWYLRDTVGLDYKQNRTLADYEAGTNNPPAFSKAEFAQIPVVFNNTILLGYELPATDSVALQTFVSLATKGMRDIAYDNMKKTEGYILAQISPQSKAAPDDSIIRELDFAQGGSEADDVYGERLFKEISAAVIEYRKIGLDGSNKFADGLDVRTGRGFIDSDYETPIAQYLASLNQSSVRLENGLTQITINGMNFVFVDGLKAKTTGTNLTTKHYMITHQGSFGFKQIYYGSNIEIDKAKLGGRNQIMTSAPRTACALLLKNLTIFGVQTAAENPELKSKTLKVSK